MLVLLIGAKGGVGTTSLALHMARAGRCVGLDLADGQLAARLERPTWALSSLALATAAERREAIDQAVKRRVTLLWMHECALQPDDVWAFVRAVADRTLMVADGGIEPPAGVEGRADAVVVVSADNPVARYHAGRLVEAFPRAEVVMLNLSRSRNETRDAARALLARLNLS